MILQNVKKREDAEDRKRRKAQSRVAVPRRIVGKTRGSEERFLAVTDVRHAPHHRGKRGEETGEWGGGIPTGRRPGAVRRGKFEGVPGRRFRVEYRRRSELGVA